MSSKSNDNGRALEYFICESIFNSCNSKLTNQAKLDQLRDAKKLPLIKKQLVSDWHQTVPKFITWLKNYTNNSFLTIDRLIDNSGKVSDIEISYDGKIIGFSVKNNSDSLKHPRPFSLAQACGFKKNSTIDLEYRDKLTSISENFKNSIGNSGNTVFYRDFPEQKEILYSQVSKAAVNYLNQWNEKRIAKNLFLFMVSKDFFKIKITPSTKTRKPEIIITNFFDINLPDTLNAYIPEKNNAKNNFVIAFNNDWIINFRIHTAKSNIEFNKNVNLKWDVTSISNSVKEVGCNNE